MSICLVIWTIFLTQTEFNLINSLSTDYHPSETGRKLFGGYRILPRPCEVKTEENDSVPKTGICMFNYECNRRKGQLIGSCIDGFLFGVCCSLPESLTNVELDNDDSSQLGTYGNYLLSSLQTTQKPFYSSNRVKSTTTGMAPKSTERTEFSYERTRPAYGEISTEHPDKIISSFVTGSGATYMKISPIRKPITNQYFDNQTNGQFTDNPGYLPSHGYPVADTILLNHDGTIVEDDQNPEKIFTPRPPSHDESASKPAISSQTLGNKVNFGYVNGNEQVFNRPSTQPELIASNGQTLAMDKHKLSTEKYSGTFTQGVHSYVTQHPHQWSTQSQSWHQQTFTKNPDKDPASMTTSYPPYKKTESASFHQATLRPNPPFIFVNDNMILLQTFTNQNKIKKPTTRIPTESTQVTSKASYKPAMTKKPVKPATTPAYDLDDKFSSFNYNFYTGSSRPPTLMTTNPPVGLEDSGEAINHILGILNATDPKPEMVTQSVYGDAGFSTWVSILGDEYPAKNKYSKPASVGATSTAYVHGPSFSVTANDDKPTATVVAANQETATGGYYGKPTRRPSTTKRTTTKGPTTGRPTEGRPTTRRPTTRKPTTERPTTGRPTTRRPTTKQPIRPTYETTTQSRPYQPGQFYDGNVFHGGQENMVNFPPVRNPDLNTTSANQLEKPTVVQGFITQQNDVVHLSSGVVLDVAPDEDDLNAIDADDESYDDMTTPSLQEEKVQGQVHTFVEKIVNSLSGNFQDLEQFLFKNENKSSITNANGIQLNNIYVGEGIETITTEGTTIITSTKRPLRRPTTTIGQSEIAGIATTQTTGTKRPRPTTPTVLTTKRTTTPPSTATETTRPTKKPSTVLIGTATATKRPTTAIPTKRPSIITSSKRPTSTTSATTKKPTTTKKPKPTTTTTMTTTTTEVSETEVTAGVGHETTSASPPVNFRRECGVRPLVKKNGRIVGGKGSQFGYYPWQVLVRESTWLGLFTKNKCGGVLITNRYVITAAHCQPGFLASLVAVFGEYDISGDLEPKRSIAKNVRRVIVHRQYDPATFENDLALLELDSPVTYDEHIVPICMPREGEDYVGRMATVTGWGRLKYGGGVPSVLQEVRVPLIENSVCQEMFHTAGHQKRIIGSFLCAGYANGQKDSCEGDSGGPLMVEREDGHWVLLGTVSHGIKCAAPYLPGVYMRTTYFKPWLKSITGVAT